MSRKIRYSWRNYGRRDPHGNGWSFDRWFTEFEDIDPEPIPERKRRPMITVELPPFPEGEKCPGEE